MKMKQNYDARQTDGVFQGRIPITREVVVLAASKNATLQQIKTWENYGFNGKNAGKNAVLGAIGEFAFMDLLKKWGLDERYAHQEYANRDTGPDIIGEDGLTIEIKTCNASNSLYLKKHEIKHIKNHKEKGKARDVYVGLECSWERRGLTPEQELKMLWEKTAEDYTGERPHLRLVGFSTRQLVENMIKNAYRQAAGDAIKPCFPKPLLKKVGQVMNQNTMTAYFCPKVKTAEMVLEGHTLFGASLLKPFLTAVGNDKWERAGCLIA